VLGAGVGACVALGGVAAAAAGGEARSLSLGLSLSKVVPRFDAGREQGGHRQARADPVAGDRHRRLAWDRALARFRQAEAALAVCGAEQAALPAALRAWPHSQALDDRFGRLDDVRLAALRRLLRTPAPDLRAVALKIDLTIADQAWELTGGEACLARLRADAGTLASAADRLGAI
jgi:hypothetical protein